MEGWEWTKEGSDKERQRLILRVLRLVVPPFSTLFSPCPPCLRGLLLDLQTDGVDADSRDMKLERQRRASLPARGPRALRPRPTLYVYSSIVAGVGADVVDDAVDAFDFVDDPRGNSGQRSGNWLQSAVIKFEPDRTRNDVLVRSGVAHHADACTATARQSATFCDRARRP